jgi:hypothetical protein
MKISKTITKSEKIGLAKKGNIEKFNSYSEAFKRIKESNKAGFYLEAIAIEESIIFDRLYSILLINGIVFKKDILSMTLGHLIRSNRLTTIISSTDLSAIEKFWYERCISLHQICKSYPKTPTLKIDSFLENSRKTSLSGLSICRALSVLAKQHQKKHSLR